MDVWTVKDSLTNCCDSTYASGAKKKPVFEPKLPTILSRFNNDIDPATEHPAAIILTTTTTTTTITTPELQAAASSSPLRSPINCLHHSANLVSCCLRNISLFFRDFLWPQATTKKYIKKRTKPRPACSDDFSSSTVPGCYILLHRQDEQYRFPRSGYRHCEEGH